MKIAVLIPTASILVGGGEIYPLLQAQYLAINGQEVDVYLLKVKKENSYISKYKEVNKKNTRLNIKYLDTPKNFNSFEDREITHGVTHELYFAISRSFERACVENQYDWVLTHYGPAAVCVPEAIKQLLYLHGVPSTVQTINYAAVRIADKLAAVSCSVRDGWENIFGAQNISLQYNGVDENVFYPQNTNQDIDLFYVGRLIEIKGVQHLIKAVAYIRDKYNLELKVTIGGKGPYLNNLMNLCKTLNLKDNVNFIGYISEEDLPNYYRRSKICVFPSFAKEGVLSTMLEAAATQKAIITANCCGMIDFLKHDDNGLLFEPQNSQDLGEKIMSLIKDPILRNRLAKKAHQDILEDWTWDKQTKKTIKLLKKCNQ